MLPFVHYCPAHLLAGWDGVASRLIRMAPGAIAYMSSVRKAVARRPIRLSFLLMWAPLPTAFCPFLVGFVVPHTDLPLRKFVIGAVPSKYIHLACDIFVGIEAGSLAEAFGEVDAVTGRSNKWAPMIAGGALVLTIVLVAAMALYVHEALNDIKAKSEDEDDVEEGIDAV